MQISRKEEASRGDSHLKSGLKYNLGADAYCHALKIHNKLFLKRTLQEKLHPKYLNRKIPFKKLEAREKKELRQLLKIGLVKRFPERGDIKAIQFSNEENWLKKELKKDQSKKRLSLTQKIWIYSIAQDYKVNEVNKNWKEISLALIVSSLPPGTGQQKLSHLLNRSRRSINQNLIENQYVKVINQHIKVSSQAFSKFKNKEQFNSFLNRSNLKGYKVNFKGEVFRQIANDYKLELKVSYNEYKSFQHSNKVLNKSLNSQKNSNAGPLKAKEISIKRIARRNKKFLLKALGVKKKVIESSSSMSERFFTETHLKSLPSKIHKEVRKLSTMIKLTKEFSEKNNVKRLKIHKGSWREEQKINLSKHLVEIQNHQSLIKKEIKYHSLRKTQRQSMAFFFPSSSDYVGKFM